MPAAAEVVAYPWLSHQAVGGEAVRRRFTRREQPAAADGYQDVAVPAPVVDADVGHGEEVTAHFDAVVTHRTESHARNMMADMRQRHRSGREAVHLSPQPRHDGCRPDHRFATADRQRAIGCETRGDVLEPIAVGPRGVVGESLADRLADDE